MAGHHYKPISLPDHLLARIITPALLVDLERVRSNAARIIDYCGGDPNRWRPHIKTLKIPRVYAEVVRSGVEQFKCATTREAAEMLQVLRDECGGGDLLIAYPLLGPALTRATKLAAEYPESNLSVLCEDEKIALQKSDPLGVFVDVNPGMNRTGIPAGDMDRIVRVAKAAGSRFRGIHYYDGHLHSTPAGKRRAAAADCYDKLVEVARNLTAAGIPPGELVTSGTPTFLDALAYEGFNAADCPLHRISPGTVTYHDFRSDEEVPGLGLTPAALVLSRVVSRPAPDVVTCDAGSKSISAEAGDPCAIVIGRPDLTALTASEEHLPFRVTAGTIAPARGDLLYLLSRHICPTANLAEEAIVVDGDQIEIAPVSARAHELLPGFSATKRSAPE